MALALHELATNALKYGALSAPAGQVRIDWNLAHDGRGERHLSFVWEECDGPPVTAPTRKGFGTRLLARTFAEENGGCTEVQYNACGLKCVMRLPLTDSVHPAILDVSASTPP